MTPSPARLLVNAHSRRGAEMFDAAVQALRAAGINLAGAHATQDEAESESLIKAEVAAGAPFVIVGGGDGTISRCANHLVGTSTAMAALPLGTGNTFVRSLGIPVDLEGAANVIAQGHAEGIDVGLVNGRAFLNSVAIGLSAEIADSLDENTKRRLGLLAWPVAGTRALKRQPPLRLKLSTPQGNFRLRSRELVIANGRYVAGPIPATPDASLQDGRLDLFTLGQRSTLGLLRAGLDWLRGRVVESPATFYLGTRAVRVEVGGTPVVASVDGETDESTPLDVKILPRALRVIVPPGFNAKET